MASMEEKVEEPAETIKQKCVNCLKGSNLLKTLVVLFCTGVVIQQISSCVQKLIDIPITTYTHFDFNKTIVYPSVTFCREPAYKYEKMLDYKLYSHPRFTSVWRNFNFSATALDELWDDIVYDKDDFFVQYGLEGQTENVDVKSTLGFVQGRCYTLSPRILSRRATRETGYSVTLQHSASDIANNIGTEPPGYHVFIHYTREPYTEVQVYNGGLVDYLYVHTGETIDVKLKVNEYIKVGKEDDPCTNAQDYSANACTTERVWNLVAATVGCSGPWIINSYLPRCSNYTTMRHLIATYMNFYQNHNVSSSLCPRFCRSYLYSAFVINRQSYRTWDPDSNKWYTRSDDVSLQTTLYIHFNAMMVSVYEERYNYDWNLFISDLGGSVGFLLGLSVIGLMTIFGKFWAIVVQPFIKNPKTKKDAISVNGSITTVSTAKAVKDQDQDRKYSEWNFY